ncbi:hypothetical protein BKK49_05915 [Rodentibacter rarus]|nr:hypothetical protein BKK49_05915 [Rodentibacter rarus]
MIFALDIKFPLRLNECKTPYHQTKPNPNPTQPRQGKARQDDSIMIMVCKPFTIGYMPLI